MRPRGQSGSLDWQLRIVHNEARPSFAYRALDPKEPSCRYMPERVELESGDGHYLCQELGQLDNDWRHIDPPYICLLQVHQMGSH